MPGLALQLPGRACRQWQSAGAGVDGGASEVVRPPALKAEGGGAGLALPGRACKAWRQSAGDGDAAGGFSDLGAQAAAPRPGLTLPSVCCRGGGGDRSDESKEMNSPTLRGTLLPLVGDAAAAPDGPGSVLKRACRRWDSRRLIPENLEIAVTQRYELQEQELGAGTYGRVFLARDREAKNRHVAIKKVSIADGDMRQNFEREVLIMKNLDHPNICQIFESYDHGRTVYLVMEYCAGGDLYERISREERLPEATSVDLVRQIASALKYAHGRGIAHRDLKPENVCFCTADPSDNHVKVIDWGVSFCFGQSNARRMRSNVGSIAYTAPEVLSGTGSYTAACDMWSLGVLTYCMMSGELPFSGAVSEQLRQMTEQFCPKSDSAWGRISIEGKAFVQSLICSDPVKRLSVVDVLCHPWLRLEERTWADGHDIAQILDNMNSFRHSSSFFSLCAATVARQLDHQGLEELRRAFQEMDSNSDGVLQLHEFRDVFARIYGDNSPRSHEIDQLFEYLDLNGSGEVDYSEFCAAALGERLRTDADALWAVFKAFDAHDGDGRLSREEIIQALRSAEVPAEVCEKVTSEIFERFDGDRDGSLDFHEWRHLMREYEGHGSGRNSSEWSGSRDDGEHVLALSSPGETDPKSPGGSPKDPRGFAGCLVDMMHGVLSI